MLISCRQPSVLNLLSRRNKTRRIMMPYPISPRIMPNMTGKNANIRTVGSNSLYSGIAKRRVISSKGLAIPGLFICVGISSPCSTSSSDSLSSSIWTSMCPLAAVSSSPFSLLNSSVGIQPSMTKALLVAAKCKGASAFWVCIDRYSSAARIISSCCFFRSTSFFWRGAISPSRLFTLDSRADMAESTLPSKLGTDISANPCSPKTEDTSPALATGTNTATIIPVLELAE